MTTRLRILVLVAITMLPLITPAQSKSGKAVPETQTQHSIDSLRADLRLVQVQHEMTLVSNERILQTVYWALGSLATFALLLVGFNWYTNFRIYDRDRNALLQELSSAAKMQVAQLREETHKDINSRFKELSDATDARIRSFTVSVDDKFTPLREQIFELKFLTLKADYRYWELNKVPGNMLTSALEMLALSIKNKAEFEIGSSLSKITDLLKGGTSMFTSDTFTLASMLDSLPSKYSADVDVIRTLLRSMRAKTQ